jgi:hypothetical protein
MDKSFVQKINDNPVMKIVNSEQEMEKVAEMNRIVHDDEFIYETLMSIYNESPKKDSFYFIYIEDTNINKVVSSICLVKKTWIFDGIPVNIAEMEFVGTLEEYRGKKLIGIQNDFYNRLMQEMGLVLSYIEGIPNYYRRFGYEYCLPLLGGCLLDTGSIGNMIYDKLIDKNRDIIIKEYESHFANDVKSLYHKANKHLNIYTQPNPSIIDYHIKSYDKNIFGNKAYVLIENEQIIGYFRIDYEKPLYRYDQYPNVFEAYTPDFQSSMEVLNFIKSKLLGKKSDKLTIDISTKSPLYETAMILGANDINPYGYQVLIPDLSQFLYSIRPVLEKRLVESIFYNLSIDIYISVYRKDWKITFENGKLSNIIKTKNIDENAILRMKEQMLPNLLLGDKTICEIRTLYPDTHVSDSIKPIINILFPKKESRINQLY